MPDEVSRGTRSLPKGTSGAPTDEELAALIKPLWLKEKPSGDAQAIRGAISTAVYDSKYPQWTLDYVPDYVWDLIDIAAQRGIARARVGRSTSNEDIEVTPRMVKAGCRVFADYDARLESPGRVVTEIFRAMRREEEAQNPKTPVRDRGFRP